MPTWLIVVLALGALPMLWAFNEDRAAARFRRSQAEQRRRTPEAFMDQSKKEPPKTR